MSVDMAEQYDADQYNDQGIYDPDLTSRRGDLVKECDRVIQRIKDEIDRVNWIYPKHEIVDEYSKELKRFLKDVALPMKDRIQNSVRFANPHDYVSQDGVNVVGLEWYLDNKIRYFNDLIKKYNLKLDDWRWKMLKMFMTAVAVLTIIIIIVIIAEGIFNYIGLSLPYSNQSLHNSRTNIRESKMHNNNLVYWYI